jgi:Integrase core domain
MRWITRSESFVDSYKAELIADRVWSSQAQVELATVAWVAWSNHDRLHSSLGDIPPVEFEQHYAAATATLKAAISTNGSVTAIPPRAADGLRTSRVLTSRVDFPADARISPLNAPDIRTGPAQAATAADKDERSPLASLMSRVRHSLAQMKRETH